eukprot:TRINITY_DN955_c0_g4_i1.p1 TRINITY_DN955_c0_g4~~TRINITY_DN955_c0_g4_i1.p1  ORF type:complete len:1129 (+),score=456.93 TRINITY_DN955_c0_g4_i1:49-3387(+)
MAAKPLSPQGRRRKSKLPGIDIDETESVNSESMHTPKASLRRSPGSAIFKRRGSPLLPSPARSFRSSGPPSPTRASSLRNFRREQTAKVRVMVRVRPFLPRELRCCADGEWPSAIVMADASRPRALTLLDQSGVVKDSFDFDEVLWSVPESQGQLCSAPYVGQDTVFERTGSAAVEAALQGYHSCLLAYGQTGSGKTYTMLGNDHDPGIAPRLVDLLFEQLAERGGEDYQYDVEVSFMEIYNERVKDLLQHHCDFSPRGLPRGSPRSPVKLSPRPDAKSPRITSPLRSRSSPRPSPLMSSDAAPSSPLDPSPNNSFGPAMAAVAVAPLSLGPALSVSGAEPESRTSTPRVPKLNLKPRGSVQDGAPRRVKKSPRMQQEEEYRELRVRHSPLKGTWVDGLTTLGRLSGASDAAAVKRVIRHGIEHRATAATHMNAASSRSHAVFQLCVKARNDTLGVRRFAHINLVDLAGSERVKQSGVEGDRFVEAKNVNLSLSTLRRVIDVMIENSTKRSGPKLVVPYRESMLTWVLSESLGGNSKTTMLAAVSPHEGSREDTVNTLRYAMKAATIVNSVHANEEKCSVLLSAMQREIEKLKRQMEVAGTSATPENVVELTRELAQREDERAHLYEESEQLTGEIERQREEVQKKVSVLKVRALEVEQLKCIDLEESDERQVLEQSINVLAKDKSKNLQLAQDTKEKVEKLRELHQTEVDEAQRAAHMAEALREVAGSLHKNLEKLRSKSDAAGERQLRLRRRLSAQRRDAFDSAREASHRVLRMESEMVQLNEEYRLSNVCSGAVAFRTEQVNARIVEREERLRSDTAAAMRAYDELTAGLRAVADAGEELRQSARRRDAVLKSTVAARRDVRKEVGPDSPMAKKKNQAVQVYEAARERLRQMRGELAEMRTAIDLRRAANKELKVCGESAVRCLATFRAESEAMRQEVQQMREWMAEHEHVRRRNQSRNDELRASCSARQDELAAVSGQYSALRSFVVRECFPIARMLPRQASPPTSPKQPAIPERRPSPSPSPPRRMALSRSETERAPCMRTTTSSPLHPARRSPTHTTHRSSPTPRPGSVGPGRHRSNTGRSSAPPMSDRTRHTERQLSARQHLGRT